MNTCAASCYSPSPGPRRSACSIPPTSDVEGGAVDDYAQADDALMIGLGRASEIAATVRRMVLRESVALKATEQPIDTATAAGKASLDMLGVFAEFETSLRRERQAEGIAKAKRAGVYKGRSPSINVSAVRALAGEGFGPAAIARRLSIGRTSVYRVLRAERA